jgi:hypothetical protein
MCGNKLIAQSLSGDKDYKAVMFQRDCGATTGFSTQFSILGANKELENVNCNILTEMTTQLKTSFQYLGKTQINYRQTTRMTQKYTSKKVYWITLLSR